MKITGELLKAERINQNISVQDVANTLKLTQKIVNALEAGDMSALPAKTFVRGFVKSYAEFLKLDSAVVLRQFQEEMGSTVPMPKVPPPAPTVATPPPPAHEPIKSARPAPKQTSQNFSDNTATEVVSRRAQLNPDNRRAILLLFTGAIFLILVLVISNKIIHHFEAPPLATPVAAVTPAETVAAPEVPTPITAAASAEATSVSMETTVQTVAAEAATPPTPPPNIPEAGFEKSPEKPIEILLEARKDIELFYAKGNSRQFSSLRLSANQVQVLRSKVGLYIKAADGGAFRISVNGIDQGLAGAPNKEVKLTF